MLLPNIALAAGLVARVIAAPTGDVSDPTGASGQAAIFGYPNSGATTTDGSADQVAAVDDLSGQGSDLDDLTSGSDATASRDTAADASTDSSATAEDFSRGGGGSSGYSLPALSGNSCVGKLAPVVWTDPSRKERFGPNPNAARRIQIHTYYPTQPDRNGKCPTGDRYASSGLASYLSTFLEGKVPASFFQQMKTNSVRGGNLYCGNNNSHKKRAEDATVVEDASALNEDGAELDTSAAKEDATVLDTSATTADATVMDASANREGSGADCNCPVLIFSHGFNVPFKLSQALIEDAVSQGYIVVGIEHLYDSDYAELPTGEVIRTAATFFEQPEIYTLGRINVEIRSEDTLFVLKQINQGKISIPGFGNISRLATKVAMFGHSLGGQLSLVAMHRTQQICAGINMDGWFWNAANATEQRPMTKADARRPYMTLRQDPQLIDPFSLVTGGGPQNYVDAMKVQSGDKVMPLVTGSLHFSYTDLAPLAIPAFRGGQSMKTQLDAFRVRIGPVNPETMHKITTGFTNWFHDNTIRGGRARIRDGYGNFREVFYDRTIY